MHNRFVVNNEIVINAGDWALLNYHNTKDEIIEMLSNLIDDYDLPMPLRPISIDDAKSDFMALQAQDSSKLIVDGSFYSRYDYKYPYMDKYVDVSPVGSKSSDYFHQYNRFLCDSINSPSPYRCWTIKKFRKSMLGGLWSLKFKEVNSNVLRSCLALRKYIASQFRPSAAKAIYEHFDSRVVLDISSGWGDRLAGFHAAKNTEQYYGIDPNARLQQGYSDQAALYNTGKFSAVLEGCAEDYNYGRIKSFDTIFTSPPYFIIERYTSETTQSWQRYKKLENWLEHFLFKTLEKASHTLISGGHLILNISDVYCNHTINKICDPMNDKISTLGYEYVGAMGLKFPKRPNSKAVGDGVFCEPIWIWRKK